MKGGTTMKENIMYSSGEQLRQYHFPVELTDSTLTAFFEMCYRNGTDPAEVLAGFINDLVCGEYTRGSDERMYAQQYFDRCCYDLGAQHTFLRYLLNYDELQTLLDAIEQKQDAENDLAYYEQHPDDPDGTADFLQDLRDIIKEADALIQDLYTEYTEHTKHEQPETLEAGLQTVQDYLNKLEQLKGGNEA